MHDFAITPADLPPGSALVAHAVAPDKPMTSEQMEAARALGKAVAKELVSEINAMRLHAVNAEGEPAPRTGEPRYRSRRDLIEIASDPRFRDAHIYKIAAMEKTLAMPIDPYFVAGGPRVAVALALMTAAALAHAALARRSAT